MVRVAPFVWKGSAVTVSATLVHGTAVALEGIGAALFVGPSGSGKSDLALRCIVQPWQTRGGLFAARLVADDQVQLARAGDRLSVRAPPAIAGRLEVRGLGIVAVPFVAEAPLVLVVELVAAGQIERLPDPPPRWQHAGIALPLLRLAPFEASAPHKVIVALQRSWGGHDIGHR